MCLWLSNLYHEKLYSVIITINNKLCTENSMCSKHTKLTRPPFGSSNRWCVNYKFIFFSIKRSSSLNSGKVGPVTQLSLYVTTMNLLLGSGYHVFLDLFRSAHDSDSFGKHGHTNHIGESPLDVIHRIYSFCIARILYFIIDNGRIKLNFRNFHHVTH
jgi:hypothetical protein